jgi:hypothetical protein
MNNKPDPEFPQNADDITFKSPGGTFVDLSFGPPIDKASRDTVTVDFGVKVWQALLRWFN